MTVDVLTCTIIYHRAPFFKGYKFHERANALFCGNYFQGSKHTVVCQQPRKQKRCVAHKCVIYWYCKLAKFSLPYLQNHYANFYQIYIFCLTYTLLHILKLKQIALSFLEIFISENCQIFFTFFFFAQNYKYI